MILGIISIAWVTIVAYGLHALADEKVANENQRFLTDIESISNQLQYKLDSNEAVLSGFVAFLRSVDRSDYKTTERYAENTTAAYPHIYMMEVARKLPVAEQAGFESTLQKEWRPDFRLKDFSQLTGRPATAASHPAHTWPIVFAYPPSPATGSLFGLRLETVDYLWQTLELAQGLKAPVSSPVFELYEKGGAYILLQEAVRPKRKPLDDRLDFFGNTMAAMLVIRGESLAPQELQTLAFRHTRVAAYLDTGNARVPPVFEQAAAEAHRTEKLLLPEFSTHIKVGNPSQPITLNVARQLRWADFLDEGFMARGGILLFGLIGILWLITRHRRMLARLALEHERVAYLATHDPLTELPNRVLFVDRFTQALNDWKRNARSFALFVVDLDHFKEINDTHGHETGDLVLITCARRIQQELRSGDTVARYGGDEFFGLLSGVFHADDALKVGEKLLNSVSRPIAAPFGYISVSCSIGIAICPRDGDTLEDLRKAADQAMYQAKAEGRNAVTVHSSRDNQKPG